MTPAADPRLAELTEASGVLIFYVRGLLAAFMEPDDERLPRIRDSLAQMAHDIEAEARTATTEAEALAAERDDVLRLARYFTGGPTGWDEANVLARRIAAALAATGGEE